MLHHSTLRAFAHTTRIAFCVVAMLAMAACGRGAGPTPQPTPLPAATLAVVTLPTPTPTLDVVYEYDKATIAVTSDYSRASGTIQDLLDASGNSPALFADTAWRESMEAGLANLDASTTEARAIVPPPQFELAHQEFLLAADGVNQYTTLIRQAFTENNFVLIADATQAIREATRHLDAYYSLVAAAR